MKRSLTMILLVLGLSSMAISCAQDATHQELEKMCEHLAELRGEANDKSSKDKCIKEAKAERVSKRQALCRISAINKSEYWNRCRTGKARPRKPTN